MIILNTITITLLILSFITVSCVMRDVWDKKGGNVTSAILLTVFTAVFVTFTIHMNVEENLKQFEVKACLKVDQKKRLDN